MEKLLNGLYRCGSDIQISRPMVQKRLSNVSTNSEVFASVDALREGPKALLAPIDRYHSKYFYQSSGSKTNGSPPVLLPGVLPDPPVEATERLRREASSFAMNGHSTPHQVGSKSDIGVERAISGYQANLSYSSKAGRMSLDSSVSATESRQLTTRDAFSMSRSLSLGPGIASGYCPVPEAKLLATMKNSSLHYALSYSPDPIASGKRRGKAATTTTLADTLLASPHFPSSSPKATSTRAPALNGASTIFDTALFRSGTSHQATRSDDRGTSQREVIDLTNSDDEKDHDSVPPASNLVDLFNSASRDQVNKLDRATSSQSSSVAITPSASQVSRSATPLVLEERKSRAVAPKLSINAGADIASWRKYVTEKDHRIKYDLGPKRKADDMSSETSPNQILQDPQGSFLCPKCTKSYVYNGRHLEKHVEMCNGVERRNSKKARIQQSNTSAAMTSVLPGIAAHTQATSEDGPVPKLRISCPYPGCRQDYAHQGAYYLQHLDTCKKRPKYVSTHESSGPERDTKGSSNKTCDRLSTWTPKQGTSSLQKTLLKTTVAQPAIGLLSTSESMLTSSRNDSLKSSEGTSSLAGVGAESDSMLALQETDLSSENILTSTSTSRRSSQPISETGATVPMPVVAAVGPVFDFYQLEKRDENFGDQSGSDDDIFGDC